MELWGKLIESVGAPVALLAAIMYGLWRWGFDPRNGMFSRFLQAHLQLVADTRRALGEQGNTLRLHTEADAVVQQTIASHMEQMSNGLRRILEQTSDQRVIGDVAKQERRISIRNGLEMCRSFKLLGVSDTEGHVAWLQAQYEEANKRMDEEKA